MLKGPEVTLCLGDVEPVLWDNDVDWVLWDNDVTWLLWDNDVDWLTKLTKKMKYWHTFLSRSYTQTCGHTHKTIEMVTCLNDPSKYGYQHHSVFAMGFALWSKSIMKFLVSSNHSKLYQKKQLAFLICVPPAFYKLSTASFLKKNRDTVCTDSNHQVYETCSQYLQTLCKMECSPSQWPSRKCAERWSP